MKKENIGLFLVGFLVFVLVLLLRPAAPTGSDVDSKIKSDANSRKPESGALVSPKVSKADGKDSDSQHRLFVNMKVLEANAVLKKIMDGDYDSIFQSWLDAGRSEHDLAKQDAIASQLGGLLRIRPPSDEFVQKLRGFIVDSSNSRLERGMLLSSLSSAATKQTEGVLIDIASHASDDVTRGAIGEISTFGTNYGGQNQEELAPSLEELWKTSSDESMQHSAAKAMAQVGAPSSVELLLASALAPKGQDDRRRRLAVSVLTSANMINPDSVPPLAQRLSNESPESDTSKFASDILERMGTKAATKALVSWIKSADSSAAPLAEQYSEHTLFPEIWQAASNATTMYKSEENRVAVAAGLTAFRNGRKTEF